MRVIKHTKLVLSLAMAVVVSAPLQLAYAACSAGSQSCSSNFQVDQTFFGSGGDLQDSSTNYKAKTTAGEIGIGNTASASYQAYAGFNTTDKPFLEFTVTAANIDLGVLNTSTTATATGTFSVRAWQAGGYIVTTAADPPKNNNYTLTPLASPTAPTPGQEQFGINLVANTTPTAFGSNPQQIPDATFSHGQVAAGYDTPNLFKYVKGDTIAYSNQSTSVTKYTVSYIFNIKPSTAGGTYTFNHVIVATGTY